MASLPSYVVFVQVLLSSTPQANINVTLRNERTGNSQSQTTNSNGEAIFDAANLTGGVATSDVLTVFTLYTSYEASSQHTVTEGGTDITLTLTAVPAFSDLRYFTVQQLYEAFGYPLTNSNTELIPSTEIIRVGRMVEFQIDEELHSKFDSNSGSYYTQTEYIDTRENNDVYFLTKVPVISPSSIRTTQDGESSAPDISTGTWTTLTNGTDFKLDLDTGRIFVITDQYKPITRRNGLYASYTHGRATVPQDIKRLAMLMTMENFWMASLMKNAAHGRKLSFSANDFLPVTREIQRIKDAYKTWYASGTV